MQAMQHLTVFMLQLVLFSVPVLSGAQTSIISRSGSVNVTIGHLLTLQCVIKESGSLQVNWYFLNHGIQLTSGNQLLVHSVSQQFSVSSHIREDGTISWDLNINSVTADDAGHYKCEVPGHGSIVYDVIVRGSRKFPVSPTVPSNQAYNFTECCTQQNVSRTCWDLCILKSLTYQEIRDKYLNCFNDSQKIIVCASDNRNHVPCCRRRNVPVDCLDLCSYSPPINPSTDFICFISIEAINSCAKEGQILLSGPPSSVSAETLSDDKIIVKWLPPVSNPSVVTGYRIQFKQKQQSMYDSTGIISNGSPLHYIISDLARSTFYDVHVIAINGLHGSSRPSYDVEVLTDKLEAKLLRGISVLACCEENGVPLTCRSKLCTAFLHELQPDDITDCALHLKKIFPCLTTSRNHTKCCQLEKISKECLHFCDGTVAHYYNLTLTHCIMKLPLIDLCIKKGVTTIPLPPTNVSLAAITDSTAEITWTSRSDNNYDYFLVRYRQRNFGSDMQAIKVKGTFENLIGLKPSTEYEVSVASVSSNESSLPSPTLIFLTYPAGFNESGSVPPAPSHRNVTGCCIAQGITDQCIPLCGVTVNFTEYTTSPKKLFNCYSQQHLIWKCISDHRNHTGCCIDRNLRSDCLKFCAFTNSTPEMHLQHLDCLPDILTCYHKSNNILLKYPDGFIKINVTQTAIAFKWTRMKDAFYLVEYKEKTAAMWIKVVTQTNVIVLQHLKVNTEYMIRVFAGNKFGFSMPSPTILQYTMAAEMPPSSENTTLPYWNSSWADAKACCGQNNVSNNCRKYCDSSQLPDSAHCLKEADSIVFCAGEGKDHSRCCKRSGVPRSCLPYCLSQKPANAIVRGLCLGYISIYFACFHENKKNLPSPPSQFYVTSLSSRSVIMKWNPPITNQKKYVYIVLHIKESQPNLMIKEFTKNTTYKLSGLTPLTIYRVSVMASNTYGNSVPASWIQFITRDERAPQVKVKQDPEGIIDLGKTVILICIATGSPESQVTWRKNQKILSKTEVLILHNITSYQSGKYVCSANNGIGKPATTSLVLNIMYKPVIVGLFGKSVAPDTGKTVVLICAFKGHPTYFHWTGPKSLEEENRRFYHYIVQHFTQTITDNYMIISPVKKEDLGVYTCNGSNHHGWVSGHVTLKDIYQHPNISGKTINPESKVINLTECCRKKKIPPACLPACSFDVDLNKVLGKNPSTQCLAYVPQLLQCASDGKDHSQCCLNNGVSATCTILCAGFIPEKLNKTYFACVDEAEVILRCMQDGNNKIPSAPLNVTAVYFDNRIIVKWLQPEKNADKVSFFNLFYEQVNAEKKEVYHILLENKINMWEVINIIRNVEYKVWLIAGNHYGNSQNSNIFKVYTGGEEEREKELKQGYSPGKIIGITFSVIILIGVMIFILYVVFRRYKKRSAEMESAFQNPGYNDVTMSSVSDVPGVRFGAEKQFNYGQLNEDQNYQNFGATLPNESTTGADSES